MVIFNSFQNSGWYLKIKKIKQTKIMRKFQLYQSEDTTKLKMKNKKKNLEKHLPQFQLK